MRFPLSVILPFWVTVWTASVISLALVFFIYRRYVFARSARPVRLELRDFLVVNFVTSLLIAGSPELTRAALAPWWDGASALALSHAAAIAAGAALNFVGHRRFTFRPPPGRGMRDASEPRAPIRLGS